MARCLVRVHALLAPLHSYNIHFKTAKRISRDLGRVGRTRQEALLESFKRRLG